MADTIIPTTKIQEVSKVLKQAIADLEAAHIAVPAALYLAAILTQRHTVDDRRQP